MLHNQQPRVESKKIQAIFFDFDGVILESVNIKFYAFQKLFKNRHPSYPYKSSEQLFREWNEVDFPKRKPNVGFGKAAKRNERNNCQLLLMGA